MRILFVADARSPIALNWMRFFIRDDHDVHVVSSFPCDRETLKGARLYEVPVFLADFAQASREGATKAHQGKATSTLTSLRSRFQSAASIAVQRFVLPVEVQYRVDRVRHIIENVTPDLVHAMRIPFEGILAAKATPPEVPLLISAWGNDFTLWASRNPLIARQTRQALNRADALHCDCWRDSDLARSAWGFNAPKPALVLPGAGGVQPSIFYPGAPDRALLREMNVPADAQVVFNPRGFRGYVRNDVFFQAIPVVLKQYPKAVFVCAGMSGNPIAERWVSRLGISNNVRLMPSVPREQMAEVFRLASIAVSPSLHDGTPNTLLEAMACGCFPVAGDIDSVREWINDGVNGLLCDPTSAESLADAIARALGNEQMRNTARAQNSRLIAERAEYSKVMQQAEEFYSKLVFDKQQIVQV
jgi:glycosyltransferase involved in cell wall biosynthesis